MLQWKRGGARLKELSGFSTLLKLLEFLLLGTNREKTVFILLKRHNGREGCIWQ